MYYCTDVNPTKLDFAYLHYSSDKQVSHLIQNSVYELNTNNGTYATYYFYYWGFKKFTGSKVPQALFLLTKVSRVAVSDTKVLKYEHFKVFTVLTSVRSKQNF